MADSATTSEDSFSLERFQSLYQNSDAVKNLSNEERERVDIAVAEKEFGLLRKLYLHLKHEAKVRERINENFLEERNAEFDDFAITSIQIEKKHFDQPQKEKREKVEEKEREAAENILKKIKT